MDGPRILIVDDSPVIRLTLTQVLLRLGVDPEAISEAETFHEAAEVFEDTSPELVFLDVSVPEGRPGRKGPGSFLEFLTGPAAKDTVGTAIAQYMLSRDPSLRIVVCTGNPPDDPRVMELIYLGAFQVLQKPIDAAAVREVMRRMQGEPALGGSPKDIAAPNPGSVSRVRGEFL